MRNRERQRANRKKKVEDEIRRCRRSTCACNSEGYCIALSNATFDGKPCPFYKTHEQARNDKGAALLHLVEAGRLDLIEKNYGGKKDVDQQT